MKKSTFASKTGKIARQALTVTDHLEDELHENQPETQTYNFTGYGGRANRGEFNPSLRNHSDILAMQQTLGNKAVQRLLNRAATSKSSAPAIVQRYRIIDENDYNPDATAKFISQQIETGPDGVKGYTKSTKDNTGVLTKERKGSGGYAPVPTPPTANGLPQLKYTEAGGKAMALENTQAEPKVMYATDNVKAESNQKLEKVGADFRIEEAGGSLDVNGINLKMLGPAASKRENTGKYKLLDEVGEVVECNSFITYILGSASDDPRVAVFKDGNDGSEHEAKVKPEKEPTKAITKQIRKKGVDNGTNTAQTLAESLEGTTSGSHEERLDKISNKRAKHFGVNEGASPEVGEGYVISSNSPMPTNFTVTQFNQALTRLNDLNIPAKQKEHDALTNAWGYHYAGVVAKIGEDNITLENYNRGTSEGWELDKMYQQLWTSSLDFRNYVLGILAQQRDDAVKMIETNKIPGVAKYRVDWWNGIRQKWEQQWQTATDIEKVQKQATNDALEKIKKSEREGLTVMKSKLYHFKMYGGLAGQSFHEQWSPVTRDPVTLRIRNSTDLIRNERTPQMEQEFTNYLNTAVEGVEPQTFLTMGMIQSFRDRMRNAVKVNDVTGTHNVASSTVLLSRSKLYKATIQTAEKVAGKTPGKLLNLLPLSDNNTLPRVTDEKSFDLSIEKIEKWANQGWAVRQKSKTELAEKRRKLNLIVVSLQKQKVLRS